ncbi:hypothetical protein [Ramlibacter sp.]|uniref:hypothetical protein n=1 Tax=Ramlibacter sp. TaxID=1917967 RepID=UPI002D1452BF|nr:hypothetical protein [Ramlibacter sp.]HWI80558.1 hypothetical protein [Ramlibacter sp.]
MQLLKETVTMNMAESLNLACLCSTLQADVLHQHLSDRTEQGAGHLASSRPHLLSATPVFVGARDAAAIRAAVAALHRITALPGYRDLALAQTPEIASLVFGPQGAFMGYDFHLSADGPRLIEINTNAGGALIHAAAASAHRACCSPPDWFGVPPDPAAFERTVLAMFQDEWRAQRGDRPLRTVAIVDDDPAGQYLAPEFEMAQRLFVAHGIDAVVADPGELAWRDGRLWHPRLPAGMPVDLVYNRLTDFYFEQPAHAGLRAAYQAGAAVVTPHPRAHALHADKRNLVILSDDARLAAWGAAPQDRAVVRAVVPRTEAVTAAGAERLWAQRRQLFFKPAAGFGSRGAYRGDKLTRRVWSDIVAGGYVAQALVPPSERAVDVGGQAVRLKVDIRAYAYRGQVQLLAARTWIGQTTNFRTAGGGFSPVVVLPAPPRPDRHCCAPEPAREEATA